MTATAHVVAIGPGHWLVVRRTHDGWTAEHNHAGHTEALTEPVADRAEAALITAAYQAAWAAHRTETTR